MGFIKKYIKEKKTEMKKVGEMRKKAHKVERETYLKEKEAKMMKDAKARAKTRANKTFGSGFLQPPEQKGGVKKSKKKKGLAKETFGETMIDLIGGFI